MRRSFGEDNLLTHIGLLLLRIKTYVLTTAQASDCLATASGFCHFSVGFDQRPIGACLGGWVGSLEMSHKRSWVETRVKAKAWGAPWVSAVTGSLPAKLNTTELQSDPVAH